MKTRLLLPVSIAALAVVVATTGLVQQGGTHSPVANDGRKVLCYQDSMHPWVKSEQPGKCPICGMALTPIGQAQAGFGSSRDLVVINSNQVTVLNVQTEAVKRRAMRRDLHVAGTLELNESSKTVVSAPARGRIDALTVDYAGVEVERGQKLITLFSPELVQLRKTLLAVRQSTQPSGTTNIPQAQIDSGIYTGDILAPQSGVVLERNVYNGQYVAEGDRLLTIGDVSVLWFRFDVYQHQLPWFELGQTIEVEVPGIPGKVFTAVISFMEPTFNETSRSVKMRADVRNPLVEAQGQKRRLLKCGMYAEAQVRAETSQVLAVPRSAILFPGGGAYTYVDKGDSLYQRRRLVVGRQGDEYWEVLNGLAEGERVVTSGNMLIDAQVQFSPTAKPEEADGEEMIATQPSSLMPHEEVVPAAAVMGGRVTEQGAPRATPPVTEHPHNAIPATAPGLARQQAGALRTQTMLAMMSPGAEVQNMRRATILAELAMKATNAAPQPTPIPSEQPPVLAANQPPPPKAETRTALTRGPSANPMAPEAASQVVAPPSAQAPAAKVLAYREGDTIRRTISAEMRQIRMAAMDEASQQRAASEAPLTGVQRELSQAFLAEAGGLSRALAGDNLGDFNGHLARLPALLQPLTNAFPATTHFNPLLRRLASSKWQTAEDLADARKQFLLLSVTVVDLARQLRKQDPAFATIRICHCPMAPEPGLWMQTQGPLHNPFFGAKMLTCGEEVP